MISEESIKYSLKHLAKRKSRSFLTILSIFIGITTIFIFISFGLGLYNYVNTFATESGADKLIVQAKGFSAPGMSDTFKLEEKDLETIQKTKGVKEALGFYTKVVQIGEGKEIKYVFSMGYEPSASNNDLLHELMTVDIIKGRMLKSGDNDKVVLGNNYMLPQKIVQKPLNVGDKILINGQKYEIVGFFDSIGNPQDDSNVYFTYDAFKNLFGDNLTYAVIFVRANSVSEVKDVANAVEKNLRKERDQEEGKEDFYVQTYEEVIAQFGAALNIVIGFVVLIALISVIVSAVNTANTMITSVLERTNEIGVMKAIGARRSEIRVIFLFESSFLGFVAGLIGVLLGWGISYIAGVILKQVGWGFLAPYYSWWLFVALIFFATIVGTLSGLLVAIQASKLNPVDALRYE